LINRAFPDRKLYLFDTFEGFNDSDFAKDKINGYIKNDTAQYSRKFLDTNVDIVLQKMIHRENCIVRKGWFPETTEGLETTFVFVSLDADLFEPIYSGLCYFFPRLAKGGYIFVHDYNNARFMGTKNAVRKYCKENQIPFFPLSDVSGTAVIMK